MGPRPVHRPLCWERLRGLLLRPGRGFMPLSMMNVVISWAIQTVFVRRIICPCLYSMRSRRFCAEDRGFLSEAGQFPFGFASWRKGDPNVSVQRIETSFRKRRNSLSGLQIGEKRSKRFCAEDRGFLSEAVQFPFGFVS